MVSKGDIISAADCPASGYGDVLERDPELVVNDLKNGLISSWSAEHVYHVAYDPDAMEVRPRHTEELRTKERQDRIKRGKSYEEFEQEWLQKQPPEEILDTYGTWPDAYQVIPIIRP